jgi:hypothetical protein
MPDRLGLLEMLDSGCHVLVELKRPKVFGTGVFQYLWGRCEYEHVGSILFIRIGGFTKELLILPDEIVFAQITEEKPVSEGVLILDDEYNNILH